MPDGAPLTRLQPDPPVLIYDGDCGICTKLADFTVRRVRPRSAIRAWQDVDLAQYGLTEADCLEALQFVVQRGERLVAHAAQNAVARVLLAAPWWWRPLGAVMLVPGVNQVAGAVYRWVARNRHRLPGGTPACSLPPAQRPGAGT